MASRLFATLSQLQILPSWATSRPMAASSGHFTPARECKAVTHRDQEVSCVFALPQRGARPAVRGLCSDLPFNLTHCTCNPTASTPVLGALLHSQRQSQRKAVAFWSA